MWGQAGYCNHTEDVGLNCGPVNESGKVYLEYWLTIKGQIIVSSKLLINTIAISYQLHAYMHVLHKYNSSNLF